MYYRKECNQASKRHYVELVVNRYLANSWRFGFLFKKMSCNTGYDNKWNCIEQKQPTRKTTNDEQKDEEKAKE